MSGCSNKEWLKKSRMPVDPAHGKRVLRKMFHSANEDFEFLDFSL
jgi:hypothetical protein